MVKLPSTEYVRFSALVEWLNELGITRYQIHKMIRDKRISQHHLGGAKRAYYHVPSIQRLLDNDLVHR